MFTLTDPYFGFDSEYLIEEFSKIRKYEHEKVMRYQQEYLGNFVKPTCSVYSINQITKGKSYCPDEVEHYIEEDGKTIRFCRRCFLNYQQGIFGNKEFRREYRF